MIDAAYTIQYDQALHFDELAWAAGNKSTFLEDFLAVADVRVDHASSEPAANVTQLKDWVESVNAKMGRGG